MRYKQQKMEEKMELQVVEERERREEKVGQEQDVNWNKAEDS